MWRLYGMAVALSSPPSATNPHAFAGFCGLFDCGNGSVKSNRIIKTRRSAGSVTQITLDRARNAGIWAAVAQPRSALSPIMPTRKGLSILRRSESRWPNTSRRFLSIGSPSGLLNGCLQVAISSRQVLPETSVHEVETRQSGNQSQFIEGKRFSYRWTAWFFDNGEIPGRTLVEISPI